MSATTCPQCRHTNAAERSTCQRCGTPLPLADRPDSGIGKPAALRGTVFRRGQIFANRYVVQDLIGRGGMGCIYKVHDNTLKETVALKTLLPEYVRDKLVVERFFNEARIARSLSHPYIVRVHDIGTAEDVVYISMEFLQGKSLRDVLDGMTPGQRLDMKTVLRVFDELCEALVYAHRFTVHRDIKPENVMIALDGKVKLMDFGISKLMTRTNLTAASMVMGTPHYMSPEQLRNSANVDARADIYSVGVMLYEVLTGNTPAGVPKPASEITHEVPPALDPIIEKCLNPDPAKRYANATELREALLKVKQAVEAGSDVLLKAPGRPAARRIGTGSLLGRKAAAAALLALIAAGAAGGIWKAEGKRRAALESTAVAVPAETSAHLASERADPFSVLAASIREAQGRAEAAFREIPEEGREAIKARIEDAHALWSDAEKLREDNPETALSMGRGALQHYLSVVHPPARMVFIPPGIVTLKNADGTDRRVNVDGFFFDERPVTAEEFWRFCQNEDWRWPPYQGTDRSYPMTGVTYYDALAYAATERAGGTIPTDAEWARAIDYSLGRSGVVPWEDDGLDEDGKPIVGAVYAVSGYMKEWTRSSVDGMAPDFRKAMNLVGGSFDTEGQYVPVPSGAMVYEQRHQAVGFRSVVEVPTTAEGAREWLER